MTVLDKEAVKLSNTLNKTSQVEFLCKGRIVRFFKSYCAVFNVTGFIEIFDLVRNRKMTQFYNKDYALARDFRFTVENHENRVRVMYYFRRKTGTCLHVDIYDNFKSTQGDQSKLFQKYFLEKYYYDDMRVSSVSD